MSLRQLRILHFNDAYEVDKAPAFAKQWANAGGPDALRLFSGDVFNPSFLSTQFKGHQFVPFFKRFLLDASAIGNHEFDWGVDEFRAINAKVKIPWLISNYKHLDSGLNFMGMNETLVKQISGFKVGVVGLVDKSWEDTSILDGKQFVLIDPVEASLQAWEQFRAQGCDFMIALTHMDTESDQRLLDLNPHIDLVLGGHNHVYCAERRGRGLLLKSGCDFKYFSELVFSELPDKPSEEEMADKPGVVLDDTTNNQQTVGWKARLANCPKDAAYSVALTRHKTDFDGDFDAEMKKEVDELISEMSGQKQLPVGLFEGEMRLNSMHIRAKESKMGNLIADLIRILLNVDVVMLQSGHIRTEQDFPANHVFRMVDLIRTFPIRDMFNISEATGADLDAIMEEGVQHAPHPRGSFPNVSGMELRYHVTKPPLDRIMKEDMRVGTGLVNYAKKYTIATIGWITKGGDGFTHMLGLKQLPVKRELSCLEAMKRFLDLPVSKSNRDEFQLVKPLLDKHLLGQLVDWRNEGSPADKTVQRVTKDWLDKQEGSARAVLQQLTLEAAERVLLYRLPTRLVDIEGHFVFSFDNHIEGRVIQMDM